MMTHKKVQMIGLAVLFDLAGIVCLTGHAEAGEMRGSVVRLTELRVKEQGFMGIVVKPLERGEPQTIVVPRRSERVIQAARALRPGQRVEIVYVEEAGHKWVERLEAEARRDAEPRLEDPRRPRERRPAEARRDPQRRPEEGRRQNSPEALDARIEGLERQIASLRAEVRRLRAQLQEGQGPRREVQRTVRREGEGQEASVRRERARSEREVALEQLEVMRVALHALREAERGDAIERLTLAIRAREMMLEGRRDEEARMVRERAPNRAQLAEILTLAARLWRQYDQPEKAVAVGRLAEQVAAREQAPVRRRAQRNIPERAPEGRRDQEGRRAGERPPLSEGQIEILVQAANILREQGRAEQAQAINRLARDMKQREASRER